MWRAPRGRFDWSCRWIRGGGPIRVLERQPSDRIRPSRGQGSHGNLQRYSAEVNGATETVPKSTRRRPYCRLGVRSRSRVHGLTLPRSVPPRIRNAKLRTHPHHGDDPHQSLHRAFRRGHLGLGPLWKQGFQPLYGKVSAPYYRSRRFPPVIVTRPQGQNVMAAFNSGDGRDPTVDQGARVSSRLQSQGRAVSERRSSPERSRGCSAARAGESLP